MMESASAHCFTNTYAFRIEGLPFDEVQGQSRLFLDYLKSPESLKRFYPEAVRSHVELPKRIPSVLSAHTIDRGLLCDALADINSAMGCGRETLVNIDMLRKEDCVAVVTGQQAGLFSGPLFTVYKALSAIRLAKCLRDRGHNAVPVFWIATEDHDFAEVARTFVIDKDGGLREVGNRPERSSDRLPVGKVVLEDSIRGAVDELFAELPHTEFSAELRAAVEDAWCPGMPFGDAFGRFFSGLFKEHGLIMMCPMDERLKRLASPLYVEAISRADELVEALRARSSELLGDGYHAQVHIAEDYFPVFWQGDDGARHALRRTEGGKIATKDGSREFTVEELLETARTEPGRISPSVVLRSVVQDFLLPTVAYFGGAAEIAYFAQSGEAYRTLGRPVTPILHRQSFTIVEPKHRKALEKYGLVFEDLFEGPERLLPRIVESHLNADAAEVFWRAEERIGGELQRIAEALDKLDPTLEGNLSIRRRKILYHIEALRRKFHAAQVRKDSEVRARIDATFAALLPNRHLQERSLNVCCFINRYGPKFIDWIYESIDLDSRDHRIIQL